MSLISNHSWLGSPTTPTWLLVTWVLLSEVSKALNSCHLSASLRSVRLGWTQRSITTDRTVNSSISKYLQAPARVAQESSLRRAVVYWKKTHLEPWLPKTIICSRRQLSSIHWAEMISTSLGSALSGDHTCRHWKRGVPWTLDYCCPICQLTVRRTQWRWFLRQLILKEGGVVWNPLNRNLGEILVRISLSLKTSWSRRKSKKP